MKVAVFSDVQANVPAFVEAIERILAWQPDLVINAGDLINRGPDSLGCLELFDQFRREQGWLPLQGNHELWVLRCGREPPDSVGDGEIRRMADFAWGQVAERVAALDNWPDHLCFDAPLPNHWVHVTHGSLLGHRNGVSASTPDEALLDRLPQKIALFIGGHTHKVHQRSFQGIEVVNVGSVGSPFDGDVRGSFGKFVFRHGRWETSIERFDYDREQTARDFETTGFLDQGGPLARLIFEEWKRAQPLTPGWRQRYESAVLAGEMTLEQSIALYLDQHT